MSILSLGKVPVGVLNTTVLRYTGAKTDRVVTPPKAGVDFAAIRLRHGFMVVSADPVTGVSRDIGFYAVKVSANDVATSGNRPEFAEVVMLLPAGSAKRDVTRMSKQIHSAALESGISIVGGHTEVTPGLRHPIVVVTVFSFVEEFVTSAGARPGDVILMTKTAGLEGTSELARESDAAKKAVPRRTLERARRLSSHLDITREAVEAFRTGSVHAMHDCTEGGVLGAVFEMALASEVGFVLDEGAVPVATETAEICRALAIDPLRLIASGALLLAVRKVDEAKVRRALAHICEVTRVGEFRNGRPILLRKGGTREVLREAPEDELWRVLRRGL